MMELFEEVYTNLAPIEENHSAPNTGESPSGKVIRDELVRANDESDDVVVAALKAEKGSAVQFAADSKQRIKKAADVNVYKNVKMKVSGGIVSKRVVLQKNSMFVVEEPRGLIEKSQIVDGNPDTVFGIGGDIRKSSSSFITIDGSQREEGEEKYQENEKNEPDSSKNSCSSDETEPITENVSIELHWSSSTQSISETRNAFSSYMAGIMLFLSGVLGEANRSRKVDNNEMSDDRKAPRGSGDGNPAANDESEFARFLLSETSDNVFEETAFGGDTVSEETFLAPPPKCKKIKPRKEHAFFRPIPENRPMTRIVYIIAILQGIVLFAGGIYIYLRR
ncbi:uncharacterized protein LOC111049367 [Nilaparvata lugens]|uniref:uncharacterized protein LOC111049367 n=1 Tax=Nilaparvata lugens TaxID=108931 RepID=UPI00193CF934|nr:uncharacterized protein LOC111049367 [Nilaparvata lugens]